MAFFQSESRLVEWERFYVNFILFRLLFHVQPKVSESVELFHLDGLQRLWGLFRLFHDLDIFGNAPSVGFAKRGYIPVALYANSHVGSFGFVGIRDVQHDGLCFLERFIILSIILNEMFELSGVDSTRIHSFQLDARILQNCFDSVSYLVGEIFRHIHDHY